VNWLTKARLITPSPAAHADTPLAALSDGIVDAAFAFGSNPAGPSITGDLAMKNKDDVDNGAIDTWQAGAPVGWVVAVTVDGTVTEATGAEARSGSALKVKKGTGSARATYVYEVRAGQRLTYEAYLRNNGAGQCQLQIYNPMTGMYLAPGLTWQASQIYVATASTTSYVQKTGAFQVESFLACQGPTAFLECSIHDTGGTGASDYALADDLQLWPTWNAVVVSGHNWEPVSAPEIRSSNDAFAGNNVLEGTMAVRQPAFFKYLATPVAKRWVRVALIGTHSGYDGRAYRFMGELAVTYLESALKGPKLSDGYTVRYLPDNVVNTMPAGKVVAARTTQQRRRVLALHFRRTGGTDAAMREVRDEIHGRCYGSLLPVIVVPIDSEDVVLHGRLDDAFEALRAGIDVWDDDLVITENAFPRVTP
jgi:hypothetical protein